MSVPPHNTLSISHPVEKFSVIRSMLEMLRFFYVLTFAIPLFNPAVSGKTAYLYLLLPLLDLEFVSKLLQFRASRKRIVSFYAVMLLLFLSLHDVVFSIKYGLMLFQVVYLIFLSKRNLARYLFVTLVFHIVFAILQMCLLFTKPDLILYVSPGYIAKLIWGNYATDTFMNFGFEFLLPRVSGLYRESAFFAAYLMGLYLFFLSEKTFRFRKTAVTLICIGIVLSFSKISAAFVFIIILSYFKKYFNMVPVFISCAGFLILFHLISIFAFGKIFNTYAYDSFGTNISIMHRMLSYYGLQYFDVWHLFFGVADYSTMPSPIKGIVEILYSEIGGLSDAFVFCGIAGIIYKGGIIGLVMFIFYLMYMEVKTAPLLILLFLTFSVTLETLQSFVILGWYHVLVSTWFGNGFLELFKRDNRKLLLTAPLATESLQ